MSNYSDDPESVRVDFFKLSGKWYTTESVKMEIYSSVIAPVRDALIEALVKHLKKPDGSIRFAGMWAVCLNPYHEHAHPQMVKVPSGNGE